MARKAASNRRGKRPSSTTARKKLASNRIGTGRSKPGLRDFCRSLPGTTEDIKWGDNLIFSVGGKMYAGFDAPHEAEGQFAFKCEEEEFMGLIQIEGIIPAPYTAKQFWVAVRDREALKIEEWKRLLKKAHSIILAKLPLKTRQLILGDGA